MKFTLIIIALFGTFLSTAQSDSAFVRKLFTEALTNGEAHEDLRSLCKDVGARISGSAAAQMAVVWGEEKMKSYGFDKVYLQKIKVPHWERGTKEGAWCILSNKEIKQLKVLALGGSIATNGQLKGKVIEFKTLDALKKAKRADVEGKIVFLNQPMNQEFITTFRAYGACYPIRGNGAVEASKLGAKAVVIRSLAIPVDDHPHTGSMYYSEDVKKIPAAALSTEHCEWLSKKLQDDPNAELMLEMNCQVFPDEVSYNVIGEMTGSENPDKFITFGGHLDSWDVGEGAHDDGAGIIHCLEALRLLKASGYQPKNTLRLVFFMNEENGNMGGKTYATWAKEQGDDVIAAVESDRGGFSPRGFDVDGSKEHLEWLRGYTDLFEPYGLHKFEPGFGGVDIGPLKKEYDGIPLFGFAVDSQRYFDFHHAESDVFENINKRELELGCASVAALLYLIDQNF